MVLKDVIAIQAGQNQMRCSLTSPNQMGRYRLGAKSNRRRELSNEKFSWVVSYRNLKQFAAWTAAVFHPTNN